MKLRNHLGGVLAVSIFAGAFAGSALAQSSVDVATRPVLEEVLVTARKREESLTDVPISLVNFDGDRLEQTNLSRLDELQAFVPNLSVTETGIGNSLIIRGIGSGENQGFDQSVGTFVDGIFRGRSQQSRMPFMDLDHVEVLRGPQSTLFGMNSIAGALNIKTAQPTDGFDAGFRSYYEPDFGDLQLNGFVSGPLSGSLSGRLAVQWRDADQWMNNLTLDRDETQLEELALRGTLAWEATPELELTLKLERSDFDSVGRVLEIVADNPAPAGPFAGLNYAQILQLFGSDSSVAINFQDYQRSSNGDTSDNETEEYVLTARYRGWGDLTLTSITGFSAYEFTELCDCDFTGGNAFSALFSEDYEQFSQELRLNSPGGETLDWLVGVYFQDSSLDFFDTLQVDGQSILIPVVDALAGPGAGALVANTGTPRTLDQDADTFAVFGEVNWSITERWRLNAGARFSWDDKSARRQLTITAIDGSPLPPPLEPFVQGLYGALFNVSNHDVSGDRSESNFMPSLSLQYFAGDDAMFYASYARGFKSGGFDARSNNAPANGGSFEFEEEQADSFEIGTRLTFADGRADMGAALFYTEYDDLQVSTFDGVLGFNVGNAARAVTRGFELDGRWLLNDQWLLSGSLAWTDFEFKEFEGQCWFGRPPDGSDGINCNYAGQTNLLTPEWSGVLSASYNNRFSNGWGFNGRLDLIYSDDYLLTANLNPELTQGAYTRLDLRLALQFPGERWELALVGKNLTDEVIYNFGNETPLAGSNFGAAGFWAMLEQPRTIAAQLSWRY